MLCSAAGDGFSRGIWASGDKLHSHTNTCTHAYLLERQHTECHRTEGTILRGPPPTHRFIRKITQLAECGQMFAKMCANFIGDTQTGHEDMTYCEKVFASPHISLDLLCHVLLSLNYYIYEEKKLSKPTKTYVKLNCSLIIITSCGGNLTHCSLQNCFNLITLKGF
ncbi:hypothetical protein ILYODFUR_034696 [Ilyodon furcidens]|uniref:Uncharacterized protein n=1 Tax=Ilyodon furcidens TaxID=33524 RepID=A0ABV0T2U8_9TELE